MEIMSIKRGGSDAQWKIPFTFPFCFSGYLPKRVPFFLIDKKVIEEWIKRVCKLVKQTPKENWKMEKKEPKENLDNG